MSTNGTELVKEIRACVENIGSEIIKIRRDFHQYPELSWAEIKTAEKLASIFNRLSIDVKTDIYKTAVVANLAGNRKGKTIAIRADMDALPIHDAKDVTYASRIPGVLHACGHDCHMAMAIGVAKVLKKLNIDLSGNVRFIFQPCEEAIPSGAHELMKVGIMDDVDGILAFHVDPEVEVGKIGLRNGIMTAHCTEFQLTIHGKSGHAARPHQAIDTVYLCNQILTAIYSIVGRRTSPFMPAVLTIGQVTAGFKANVIPDNAYIAGTIRTLDDNSLEEITSQIEEKVHALTRAAGGHYQIEFLTPVPSIYNHPDMIGLIEDVAGKVLSPEQIVKIEKVSMGGEDFSWYLEKAPGALIRLGTRKPNTEITYLHTSNFDIDEKALILGVNLMTILVLKYLMGNELDL